MINITSINNLLHKEHTGVIHCGANIGELADTYSNSGIRNVLWLESNKTIINRLYDNTKHYPLRSQYMNIVLSDIDGQEKVFSATKDPKWSSLLEYTTSHIDDGMYSLTKEPIVTKRFDSFYRENNSNLDLSKYDMIRISTNGTEQNVIKGFGRLLTIFDIKTIIVSLDRMKLYSNSANSEEIEKYLKDYGFVKSLVMNFDQIKDEVVYTK